MATAQVKCIDIVRAFGAALEKSVTDPAKLPYERELIKAALIDVSLNSKDVSERKLAREGFVLLHDFSPMATAIKCTDASVEIATIAVEYSVSRSAAEDLFYKALSEKIDQGLNRVTLELAAREALRLEFADA
jgi:hypothetical protein